MKPQEGEPLITLEVLGRPTSYGGEDNERRWKQAIRDEVARQGIRPVEHGRFFLRVEFRTIAPRTPNDQWDIDNLIKPVLDSLEGVFGLRKQRGRPQAADDRVDRIDAWKRPVRPDEEAGARIEVWLIGDD